MKKVEIKLKRSAVAPLLDFMKPVIRDLEAGAEVDIAPPRDLDRDMKDAWRADLRESLARDAEKLLDLFGRRFFEEGAIEIHPENAEQILRASAAIRLRLRERFLQRFADETLEAGEIDHASMSRDEERGYGCYLFLATLQEVVIDHLDLIEGTGS